MSGNSVIIVAGGVGSRMNQSLPKQFTLVNDVPVIIHTISVFLEFDANIRVIIALPKEHFSTWLSIKEDHLPDTEVEIVEGGNTRYQSVKKGLELIQDGFVAIHDAVRPCVDPEIVASSFSSAIQHGSGVVSVPLKDSIREVAEETSKALDRSKYHLIQTPQTFQVSEIKTAFEAKEEPFFTDDASVYEYVLQKEVRLVPGSYRNIKITTPEDLQIVSLFLS